jgi:hypothetical protein
LALLEREPSTALAIRGLRAWLVLAVGEDRQHGGNDGYDDEPAIHYSWDSTVPNHASLRDGDVIAIWDKRELVGVSVIERVDVGEDTKPVYRCPHCHLAGIKSRKTKAPRFKCYKCKAEFPQPEVREELVTTYCSYHEVGYVHLPGCLAGSELRSLCVHPQSQLSLRPLRWHDFRVAVHGAYRGQPLRGVEFRAARLHGGHQDRTVRVRIGQANFRRALLSRFGPVCAFTGQAPLSTLEAGHFYSYAAVGEHHEHGGVLLRRDVHKLFDTGELAVHPTDCVIDVRPTLAEYPAYASLAGQPLRVKLEPAHRRWLAAHWRTHRS